MKRNIKFKFQFDSAFEEACESENFYEIDYVIKKSIEAKFNLNYNSGLKGACKAGNMYLIQLMILNGANNWDKALEGACEGGHKEIVEMLLFKLDYFVESVIFFHVYKGGHNEIIDLFNNRNRVRIIIGNEYDNELLWGLKGACEAGNLVLVKGLIDDVNINRLDRFNGRIFYFACKSGNVELVKFLINKFKNKIKINWNEGLWGACSNGNNELINLMINNIKNKAEITLDPYGIIGACEGGHLEILESLMRDYPPVYQNFRVPYAYACHEGHMHIIKFLMDTQGVKYKGELIRYRFPDRSKAANKN